MYLLFFIGLRIGLFEQAAQRDVFQFNILANPPTEGDPARDRESHVAVVGFAAHKLEQLEGIEALGDVAFEGDAVYFVGMARDDELVGAQGEGVLPLIAGHALQVRDLERKGGIVDTHFHQRGQVGESLGHDRDNAHRGDRDVLHGFALAARQQQAEQDENEYAESLHQDSCANLSYKDKKNFFKRG